MEDAGGERDARSSVRNVCDMGSERACGYSPHVTSCSASGPVPEWPTIDHSYVDSSPSRACMTKRATSSSLVLRPSSRSKVYIDPERSITKRSETRFPPPEAPAGLGPRCL